MRTMEWNDWETFCRVVEAGSFTAAAGALGIPKSTASAAVSRLEAGLGVRLMTRTTRQLRLTEAGSHFYDDIAPLFERQLCLLHGVRKHTGEVAVLDIPVHAEAVGRTPDRSLFGGGAGLAILNVLCQNPIQIFRVQVNSSS